MGQQEKRRRKTEGRTNTHFDRQAAGLRIGKKSRCCRGSLSGRHGRSRHHLGGWARSAHGLNRTCDLLCRTWLLLESMWTDTRYTSALVGFLGRPKPYLYIHTPTQDGFVLGTCSRARLTLAEQSQKWRGWDQTMQTIPAAVV